MIFPSSNTPGTGRSTFSVPSLTTMRTTFNTGMRIFNSSNNRNETPVPDGQHPSRTHAAIAFAGHQLLLPNQGANPANVVAAVATFTPDTFSHGLQNAYNNFYTRHLVKNLNHIQRENGIGEDIKRHIAKSSAYAKMVMGILADKQKELNEVETSIENINASSDPELLAHIDDFKAAKDRLTLMIYAIEKQGVNEIVEKYEKDLAMSKQVVNSLQENVDECLDEILKYVAEISDTQIQDLINHSGDTPEKQASLLASLEKALDSTVINPEQRTEILLRLADIPKAWDPENRELARELINSHTSTNKNAPNSAATAGLSRRQKAKVLTRVEVVEARIKLGDAVTAVRDKTLTGAGVHRSNETKNLVMYHQQMCLSLQEGYSKLEEEFAELSAEYQSSVDNNAPLDQQESLKEKAVPLIKKMLENRKAETSSSSLVQEFKKSQNDWISSNSSNPLSETQLITASDNGELETMQQAFKTIGPLLRHVPQEDWEKKLFPIFTDFHTAETSFLDAVQSRLALADPSTAAEKVTLLKMTIEAHIHFTSDGYKQARKTLDRAMQLARQTKSMSPEHMDELTDQLKGAEKRLGKQVIEYLQLNCLDSDPLVQAEMRKKVDDHLSEGDGLRQLTAFVKDRSFTTGLSKDDFVTFCSVLASDSSKTGNNEQMKKLPSLVKQLISARVSNEPVWTRHKFVKELETKIIQESRA